MATFSENKSPPHNKHLAATDMVDRLTFGDTLIETGHESYRLTHTRQHPRHSPPRASLMP